MKTKDEALPGFVHGFADFRPPKHRPRSKSVPIPVLKRNVITQKMETPVIYFYSAQPQHVDVSVQFPEGVITETFPAPVVSMPAYADDVVLANGQVKFSVDVLADKQGATPAVSTNNIYSHARAVDSNLVRSGNEREKFIFYRGLGRFQPRLSITSAAGAVTIQGPASALPQAAFLVHVDASGNGQLMDLGTLTADQPKVISADVIDRLSRHPSTVFLTGQAALDTLAHALSAAGLRTDEANAMVNTWQNGYLRSPGLRLLYILPRNEVDQVLPPQMTPQPANPTRVFVARLEVLRDTDEARIVANIVGQGDAFNPNSLGRFAEPILHRIAQLPAANQNSALQKRLAGLIQQVANQVSTGVAALH